MNKQLSSLYLTAIISFIVGIIIGIVAMILIIATVDAPRLYRQKREAVSFFYSTMHALFEGTYNSEDGSVSPEALKKFREYEPQLGDKCRLFIVDSTPPGYYESLAFFPSGDIFDVVIRKTSQGLILDFFYPRDWEKFWRSVLYDYDIERDSKKLPK